MTITKDTHSITKPDIWAVSTENFHKELAVQNHHRLYQQIHSPLVRERLARMTLLIIKYMSLYRLAIQQGQCPAYTVESMIRDVLGACTFINCPQGPAGILELWTKEPEVEFVMYEIDSVAANKSTDWNKVYELNDQANAPTDDIRGDLDWDQVIMLRSSSESNIVYHRRQNAVEEEPAACRKVCEESCLWNNCWDRLVNGRDLDWRWPSPL